MTLALLLCNHNLLKCITLPQPPHWLLGGGHRPVELPGPGIERANAALILPLTPVFRDPYIDEAPGLGQYPSMVTSLPS